jgi:hypothetical protein
MQDIQMDQHLNKTLTLNREIDRTRRKIPGFLFIPLAVLSNICIISLGKTPF